MENIKNKIENKNGEKQKTLQKTLMDELSEEERKLLKTSEEGGTIERARDYVAGDVMIGEIKKVREVTFEKDDEVETKTCIDVEVNGQQLSFVLNKTQKQEVRRLNGRAVKIVVGITSFMGEKVNTFVFMNP